MKRITQHYLDDLLDFLTRIISSTESIDETVFSENIDLQDATLRRLEIIGEIVKRLPEEYKLQYPEIPWKSIAGTRDKLAHDYDGVDMQAVWIITQNDIPKLYKVIEELISKAI